MAAIARIEERVIERPAPAEAGQWTLVWRRFRRRRTGLMGFFTLVLLVLAVIFVPLISPFSFNEVNPVQTFATAGTVDVLNGNNHWLGTDYLGRDVFTRLFYAGRTSLLVALVSTALVVLLGTLVGAIAGFYGGWVDTALMRFADFMLALPLLPMYLFAIKFFRLSPDLAGFFNSNEWVSSIGTIALVFVLFGWMSLSRLVRGSILSLRSLDYVEAARALGASGQRIIFKHLLPNSVAPIVVAATFAVGDFIILEAVLSYFGQGIYDFFSPSWGNLLAGAQNYVWSATELNPFKEIRGYLIYLPAIMILLTVLSINYIGDALRDALDPHQKR